MLRRFGVTVAPQPALQIGIIGAGTAGLAAAIAFARAGHRVQVFEKHPSMASIGAGLLVQPQGVAALFALGVGLAQSVSAHGVANGPRVFSKKRLRTVRAYQTLSRLLTPCFQAHGNGLWRDLAFAGALYVPGVRHIMYRSIAQPLTREEYFASGPNT